MRRWNNELNCVKSVAPERTELFRNDAPLVLLNDGYKSSKVFLLDERLRWTGEKSTCKNNWTLIFYWRNFSSIKYYIFVRSRMFEKLYAWVLVWISSNDSVILNNKFCGHNKHEKYCFLWIKTDVDIHFVTWYLYLWWHLYDPLIQVWFTCKIMSRHFQLQKSISRIVLCKIVSKLSSFY